MLLRRRLIVKQVSRFCDFIFHLPVNKFQFQALQLYKILVVIIILISPGYGKKHRFCPLTYRYIGPICGTDGTTYPTWCELEAARIFDRKLEVAYLSHCKSDCDYSWAPVCGTDMMTYGNLCWFQTAANKNENIGLRILHLGECVQNFSETTEDEEEVVTWLYSK